MKYFLKAIMDRFTAKAIYSSLTGGLYAIEAKPGTAFPYGTFSFDNNQDWTFSEKFEDFMLQFDLYSSEESVEEICDLFDLLTDAFDFVDLQITGSTTIRFQRENSRLMKWMVEGNQVWNWFIVYRVKIQKN